MGGLNLVGLSQCHHQAVQAPGETVDIEIQRIVVAVGDLRVDRGMERGNKPSLGAYAGDNINERERCGASWARRRIGKCQPGLTPRISKLLGLLSNYRSTDARTVGSLSMLSEMIFVSCITCWLSALCSSTSR